MFAPTAPVMTQELALRLQQAKADHLDSWLGGMQEQMGGADDIAFLRRGPVRAFAARQLQEIGLFNRVIGLGAETSDLLEEIIRFYQEMGVATYALEINPYDVSRDFLSRLASEGFSPARFETYLYGIATAGPAEPSAPITVREITSSEVDLFASIHVAGYQEALALVSERQRKMYRESLKVLYRRLGWHLCFVCRQGLPIGMGMLYTHNGIATGAGAAILPEDRRQGGQTALVHYLTQLAVHVPASLVVAQTQVGSISQQNVERLGMRTAYTGTSWTRREP